MPTYQYRCTECGHDLEAVQKFSDAALTECPNCHGQLRKVFNAVGVVFKGSGFYRTDSRAKEGAGTSQNGSDKGEGAAAKTDGKDGGKTDGKDGGKTDPFPVRRPEVRRRFDDEDQGAGREDDVRHRQHRRRIGRTALVHRVADLTLSCG